MSFSIKKKIRFKFASKAIPIIFLEVILLICPVSRLIWSLEATSFMTLDEQNEINFLERPFYHS